MPSSYTHHVFTTISVEARSTALTQPGSPRLSAGLPLLIHVLLPFRRPAAEKTLSGWVHIPAITARLPQLTSLRSFLCERAGCQVSEAPFPFPKPLNSWASTPAKRRICFTEQPSWGQLLRFPTCGAGSVPRCTVPGPCPSGLQVAGLVAPPLNPPRRLGLEGLCEKKACLPVLTRMCGAHLRANLDGDSNGLGSWLNSPLWSLKARAAALFYVFIFLYFL